MYQLIKPSNIATDDFLETILGNRGIEDSEKFLEPKPSDEIHYSLLRNMKEAVELFKSIESKESIIIHVALVIDSDIDGNTSSAILASYIEKLFPHIKVHFIFHKGKTHGITDDVLKDILTLHKEVKLDLLFVADAGSSDYKAHYEMTVNNNLPVLVLDHHEADDGESEHALIVNNQLSPDYPNKALSGVGIVYKFLQALDDEYGYMEADTYLDLVALGNIADSMDLTSPETRYLVYEGLSNLHNEFLKEIIVKQIGDFKRVYPHTMAFGVIPKMNGIIRVGTEEEKVDLFNAFRGVEETYWNTRSKKNETLPQKVSRLCTNAHSKQKKLREAWLEVFNEIIQEKKLYENAFLLIEIDDSMTIKSNRKQIGFNKDLGGLLAGALAGDYRKPVLMLVWDSVKKQYTGSLRGFDGTMKNTKDFLEGLELFEYLGGHQNACGFRIKKPNFSLLNQTINKTLEDTDLTGEQKIDVDFYLDKEELTVNLVEEVYQFESLWGKGASKPLFATDIEIDTKLIKKSSSSNMIEWVTNGIKFVQFSGDKRLLDLMEDGHIVKLTVVGSLSINHFLGKQTPQLLIEDIAIGELLTEFTEIKEVSEGDWLNDLLDW